LRRTLSGILVKVLAYRKFILHEPDSATLISAIGLA
jgi:hypothetical protein